MSRERTGPPLLERETALAVLRAAVDRARTGRGSLVVVSGEPGIGKSALVEHAAAEHADRARVLVGLCDDLATPRPLGPFRELGARLGGAPAARLRDGLAPGEFPAVLVEELRQGPAPTVLAIEDVHWADQATTDALTVVGRRLRDLPVVLLLTVRPGELEVDHPLRATLDAVQGSTTSHLELAPLSRDAVAALAGDDADHIHALTGGNPFFVREMLAARDGPPPPSLANAVLGRVARLDPPARQVLELVSMAPGRLPVVVLERLDPGWATAVEQAERRQLVTSDAHEVRFRHELTRAAIRSSVPPGRRRRLHRRILDAMQAVGAEAAELVHHAEACGDTAVVAEQALLAARQAAAVGANREAFAHHRRAAAAAARPPEEAARVHEELARSAGFVGQVDEALRAATTALEVSERLGDREQQGRLRGLRSHLHWYGGRGQAAWQDACEAIRCLADAGSASALGWAYTQAAELSMLASRAEDTFEWARRARQLAGDDRELAAHALATVGAMRAQLDPDDVACLLAAFEAAHAVARHDLALAVLVALSFTNLWWTRADRARQHAEQGLDYARAHEVDGMVGYLEALRAWTALRAGGPDDAVRRLAGRRRTAGPRATIVDLQTRTVLAERAVRVGAPDVDERLAELWRDVVRTGELKRIGPAFELHVERWLTCGRGQPADRLEELVEVVGAQPLEQGIGAIRLRAWATVASLPPPSSSVRTTVEPFAGMIDGDWRRAADAFGAIGWPHDRALLLSLTDDEHGLTDALQLARELGAEPLQRRITSRLRERGTSVPRGPASSTRRNPAGLTDRQLEVLRLVRAGERNAAIGERLHISPRTVERHVADIFRKLGVSSRAEAVARSVDLGVG